MEYKILNQDNSTFPAKYYQFDLIYADMVYENDSLEWTSLFWHGLKENGIFIVQTDWHTNYLVRNRFETKGLWGKINPVFVNHCVQKCEWGNHPKNKFHQAYDDILIFAKGNDWKFYSERVQVPKVTNNKGLNPSGRETKQATAWIDDICLTTTAKERIKKDDGHLIKWQKPLRLFDRIVAPFCNENDWVFDPFGGVFSLGEWCILNNRNYFGIEYAEESFGLGKQRLEKVYKSTISSSKENK